ncbi:MAG: 2-C-methyl-D-erythritol 2,4-cyclodiphosphate synthase [Sphingobacteriales bacterium]|jgi:2-C-methyl-D-erythritol 2,4-cyclodiphosphate synthase
MKIRVGMGYDVHRLSEGYDFWLGGIKLDYPMGLVGHSDADVLLHTISDALLGAANLRDIGFHFPDTDDSYKGADSKVLLKRVLELIQEKGFSVGNIDATVCLQKPKLLPHIPAMKECIANILDISEEDISIKATTTERLGFVGREEGVSAYAVVLIES